MSTEGNDSPTLATPANMQAVVLRGITSAVHVVAVSLQTGEECSAWPGDYWQLPADEPLLDEAGEPMVLVYRVCQMLDALSDEEVIA